MTDDSILLVRRFLASQGIFASPATIRVALLLDHEEMAKVIGTRGAELDRVAVMRGGATR